MAPGSNVEIEESKKHSADTLLGWKLNILEKVFESPKYRQRIVRLFNERVTQSPDFADVTIVLGTSLSKYPDKFKKRVYLASQLALNKKTNLVVFTGLQDSEASDINQAEDARKLATESFALPASLCTTVGGNNTQENFIAVQKLISQKPEVTTAFIVSDSRHLLRALNVAQYEIGTYGVSLYPKPTDFFKPLDPDDPTVILEIIKILAYHRTLYHLPKTITEDPSNIRKVIDDAVNRYQQTIIPDPGIYNLKETPFEQWLAEIKNYQ